MFLQVCVCPQGGGGVPGSGGYLVQGRVCSRGVGGSALGRGGWYPSMHWGRPPWERRLLLRTVRILLESILVTTCLSVILYTGGEVSWCNLLLWTAPPPEVRHPLRMAPPKDSTILRTAPFYSQQAGTTHPSGMLSCVIFIMLVLTEDREVFEGSLRAVYVESCKKAGVILLSCLFLQRTGRWLKAPSGRCMWSPVRRLASFRPHTSCATWTTHT